MAVIGREAARAPLTSADINDGIITADDLIDTLDLSSKTLTLPSLSTVDINGGTIDGVTIGGSSAGAITGTTGQFNTSLNVDGTVTADGLTVSGTTNTPTVFETSVAASYVQFKDSGTTADNNNRIGSNGDALTLWSGGSKAVTIDASQNVGIGTASPATALDVAGTVTADGLTVDGDDSTFNSVNANTVVLQRNGGSDLNVAIHFNQTTADTYLGTDSDNSLVVGRALNLGVSRTAKFDQNGDVSLFEDTGTTAKFFWDASTERLGLGTTSPERVLHAVSSQQVVAVFESSNATAGRIGVMDSNTTGSDYVGIGADGNALKLYAGGADPVTITTTNVGIGVTSPTHKLEIRNDVLASTDLDPTAIKLYNNSDGGSAIEFSNGVSGKSKISFGVEGAGAGTDDAYIGFSTSANAGALSEAMRIDSSGNLLVGGTATNPAGSGTDGIAFSAGGRINGQVSGDWHRLGRGEDGTIVGFYSAGSIEGSISISGTTTSYNTTSDYRLKDVDGPITNSGAYIDALKPVQGSWKVDGSRFIGLIAHEVQEVSETPIATGEKDGEEMQGMDYSAPELIANLIAEIQSLRARLAQLEGA